MSEHRQPLGSSVILMGVSGCGKSTVGTQLAEATGALFFDGDDFHPPANIAKMASGTPLTDDDRQAWLTALRDLLNEHSEQPIIIACSALKQSYRKLLETSKSLPSFVHLHGTRETLLARLKERSKEGEHFMPTSLLDSQIATLENPGDDTLTVSIENTPQVIVTQIISQIT
jgi:gluconokinase